MSCNIGALHNSTANWVVSPCRSCFPWRSKLGTDSCAQHVEPHWRCACSALSVTFCQFLCIAGHNCFSSVQAARLFCLHEPGCWCCMTSAFEEGSHCTTQLFQSAVRMADHMYNEVSAWSIVYSQQGMMRLVKLEAVSWQNITADGTTGRRVVTVTRNDSDAW